MVNNPLLVNYHDACIYQSDINILSNPRGWLNSSCIHFFMELMQYKQGDTSESQKDLFMDPTVVSYFIHCCCEDNDIIEFTKSNKLMNYERIFLPVNNAFGSKNLSSTGSHWSLLIVVSKSLVESESNVYMHFDSANGMNSYAASVLANKLEKAFKVSKSSSNEKCPIYDTQKPVVQECRVPQQHNANDCGIYVLNFVETLRKVATNKSEGLMSLKEIYEDTLSSFDSTQYRHFLLREIKPLLQHKDGDKF